MFALGDFDLDWQGMLSVRLNLTEIQKNEFGLVKLV